jgi:hypothetical protein
MDILKKCVGPKIMALEASFQKRYRAVEIFQKVRFFGTRSIPP